MIDWQSHLEQTGYPVDYHHFEGKEPKVPYIVWYIPTEDRRGSDDRALLSDDTIMIELYHKKKDNQSELVLEELLRNFEYRKNKSWVSDENLYLVAYEIQLLRRL